MGTVCPEGAERPSPSPLEEPGETGRAALPVLGPVAGIPTAWSKYADWEPGHGPAVAATGAARAPPFVATGSTPLAVFRLAPEVAQANKR